MERNASERIAWVDVAKGIAILLMVVGHSSLPMVVGGWIFAFHMPLFFILSGMTTKWKRQDWMHFAGAKLVSLGRPFVIYSLICLLIIKILGLASLTWSSGWGDFALWFVPVLFAALLMTKLLAGVKGWTMWLLIMIFAVASGGLRVCGITFPWNMSVAPLAAFFIAFGWQAKRLFDLRVMNRWWMMLILFGVTLGISLFWRLDMARNQCLPLVPLIIGAIAGTLFITSISQLIDRYARRASNILQSVGRETFIILAFSQIFILTLNKYWLIPGLLKYALLAVALIAVKYLKDFIVNIYRLLTAKDLR